MNQKFLLVGIIFLVVGFVLAAMQTSYAQEAVTATIEDVEDNTVVVVLIAATIGGLAAPIIGFAAKKEGKFDWKQYAMAVIIGVPGTMGLILAEVMVLQMSITNLASVVVLFIMVFTQALGIDYAKSKAKKAITN